MCLVMVLVIPKTVSVHLYVLQVVFVSHCIMDGSLPGPVAFLFLHNANGKPEGTDIQEVKRTRTLQKLIQRKLK